MASAAPWTAVAVVAVFGAFQMGLIPRSSSTSPASGPTAGPAKAVSLPGGGFSDGDRCGTRDYHHFPLPPGAESPEPSATDSGPRMVLGSHGYEKLSSRDPGHLTVGLRFDPGRKKLLELSRTLGGQGVAVEIEGPQGLVGGAHGLPVSWSSDVKDGAFVKVSGRTGGEITLPPQALCPGYDARSVAEALRPPTDSHDTITGQPRYRLVVSLRDPAVGTLRTALGLPAQDSLLSANNLVPQEGSWTGGRGSVTVKDV
ncbi:hypothetical protein VT52_019385 [Streptomyces malaysiense]|uniref:Uncharacterized protein n=1 Tax=Streptomyces malaysiense TaxID=1428626 RepID=A0A1J4Q0Q5_9ACTN|nr:hypothetical protein VT52_019385 [Streptomyces malaysiense]